MADTDGMDDVNLLAELDEMDCWCGKDPGECEEDGGCRWSRQVTDQGEKIGRLRLQVASLGGEVDGLKGVIARVREANDNMRFWCSPYGFAARCAEHIDGAFAEPEGDQS